MEVKLRKYVLALGLLATWGSCFAQQITEDGVETAVNTITAGTQQFPKVAANTNGDYLVVWSSNDTSVDTDGYGIYIKGGDAAGGVILAEGLVNSGNTNGEQVFADVALNDDGNYVVAWMTDDGVDDGDGFGIRFSHRNLNGSIYNSERLVNTTIAGVQRFPSVAISGAGSFAIVWESDGDIYMQRYTNTSVATGGETLVNTTTDNLQTYPDVAMDNNGNIVVVWQSMGQDGDGGGVYGQRFNAAGTPQGDEFRVSETTAGDQLEPSVAMNSTADFVVAWSDSERDGRLSGIYAQQYFSNGTTNGDNFRVNTATTNYQLHPSVDMSPRGEFAITWASWGRDSDQSAVMMQVYNFEQNPKEGEQQVNTNETDFQTFPAVAFSDDVGKLYVVWQDGATGSSTTQEGDEFGIYQQIYDIADLEDPVAVANNVTLYLDNVGDDRLRVADVEGGSTDNVGIVSTTISKSNFDCSDIGDNNVTLTVTDAAGNIGRAISVVTVLDTLGPTVGGRDLTLYVDETGTTKTLTRNDISNGRSTDNCGVTLTIESQDTFTCDDLGENTLVFRGTDPGGNIQDELVTITVLDTISPTAVARDNLTLYLGGSGTANITAADLDDGSTDNCSIDTYTASLTSFDCSHIGVNTVTLTVADASGNSASGTTSITVVDSVGPTLSVQDITVALDATGNVSITADDIDNGTTDNCSVASLALDKTTFTTTDVGTNTVLFTATDVNGNSRSTSVTVTVNRRSQTVNFDAVSSKTYGNADFTLSASATSGLGVTFTSDDPSVISVSGSNASIVGAGTVRLTASQAGDAINEPAPDVTQDITVSKAGLIVTSDDQSKTYGDANPALTISIAGFVNGEDETVLDTPPIASTLVDELTDVGAYSIEASGGLDDNYAFDYVDGLLTINKASLTVTAEDKNKTYGDDNPLLTVNYVGFVNSEDATVLDTSPTISTTADANSAVGTYPIMVSGGIDNNYGLSYVDGTMTVIQATLTVTADNKSKTYGDVNPPLTIRYTGFVNGEDASVLDTPPAPSTIAEASSNVDVYLITPSGGVDNNYAFDYFPGQLTINPATLTATADDQSKVYGESNPVLTITLSGFVNGDDAVVLDTPPVASTSADATSNVGTYPITPASGADNNYTFNYVTGTLTVNQATLTVTADNKSKTYGDSNPALTVSYAGFVNSDDAVVLDTPPVASTLADATSEVGTYLITAAGGVDNNYTFSYSEGTLTVNQATLTVTADNKSKTYGDSNPALTVSYAGFVNSDDAATLDTPPVASTSADATSDVGTYPITVAGGVDNNYTFSYSEGTLTVNQATLTVTADNKSKTYGDSNPALTVSYAGFVNSDDAVVLDTPPVASTSADATSEVGTYPITAAGGVDNNYTFSYSEGTLTVNQATLTVTADNKSKTYGDSNPALTVSYAGFVNSDDAATLDTPPVASTSADVSSEVGTYPITAAGGMDNNYTFSYSEGTLTVNQATLTVTADNKRKTYGDSNPAFTVSYAGFVNSDDAATLDTPPVASTMADASSEVGTYPITAAGGVDNNYTFSYSEGTLTVNQATLTVTADNKSKTYGDSNPALTVSYAGFVNSDDAATLDTPPVASTSADATSEVGTYPITAAGGVDNNYTFSYSEGTLTVNQATLTVTADNKSKTYGDSNPALTVSYAGFVNSDDAATLDTPPVASTSADVSSEVGTYPITAAGGMDNNYTFSYSEGTLTVNQATLTVTADNKSKTYGDSNPALTVSYAGFVNSDDAATLDTPPVASTSADATSEVGTYPITAAGGSDNNYTFSYSEGTLTVNQATLTVTADNKSKTYGDSNPALTVSYAGFVNSDDAATLDTPPVASTMADASSEVGTYPITAAGGSDNNYTFSYSEGTLTVNQATLTVTADNKSKTYGDSNPALTVSYAGFVNSDDAATLDTPPVASTMADASSDVGTYPITAAGGSDNNYAFQYFEGTLSVGQVTLTATADNQQRTYGQMNPALTVSYTGFVNGDDATVIDTPPLVSTTAEVSSDVGTYPITATAGVDNNYTFSYVSGTLTVSQATLSVIPDDKSRPYGGNNPTLTVSYSGFFDGDDVTVLDTPPSASTAADVNSVVGTYPINASGGSDNNYILSYLVGTLTVEQATITVTAQDQSRIYGQVNPTFTVSYAGFVNGDDESVLTNPPTANTTADAGSDVGSYAIVPAGGADDNYTFDYVNGTLSISQATLTATADDKSKAYGEANPIFTASYSGFVNGDGATALDTPPTGSTSADETSPVGTYVITLAGGADNNYVFAYVDGSLTVNKATLTVTADDKSKAFGENNPELTVSYVGFSNGDDASDLTTVPTATTLADVRSPVGVYAITAANGVDENYAFSYVGGTLTIEKSTQTIAFEVADVDLSVGTIDLVASSSSGLEVIFSLLSGPATLSGNTLTLTGTGIVEIAANQAGNENFEAARQVVRSLLVRDQSKQDQDILFQPLAAVTFGDPEFELLGSASSGLSIDYTSSNEQVATINGSTLTIVGAGDAIITANQPGDDTFNPAQGVSQTLQVNKATQTITFEELSDVDISVGTVDLVVSSSVGLDITLTVITGPATLSGNTLTLTGTGTVGVAAEQAGTANYEAASRVVRSFRVTDDSKQDQTITFDELADATFLEADFELIASASSGLAVTFSSADEEVAKVVGTKVSIVGAGTTVITADQTGDDEFNPAPSVSQVLTVNKADQEIFFEALSNVDRSVGIVPLSATSSSGLEVSFSIISGPAIVVGNTITLLGTGTVGVAADQAGDKNYEPAGQVVQSFLVTDADKEDQTIDFAVLTNASYGDEGFDLEGNATSGLEVSYTSSNESVATVDGNEVTILSAGATIITAKQDGDDQFNPATAVARTLTVDKAVLTTTADNKLIRIGQELPALTFSYSGFVRDETEDVLDVAPVASVAITDTSVPGDYEIMVSGGADDNYEFNYVDGTLSIVLVLDVEQETLSIAIYPNPVFSELTVQSREARTVTIFDLNGREIKKWSILQPSATFEVSDIRTGAYVIELQDDSGQVIFSSKLIKRANK